MVPLETLRVWLSIEQSEFPRHRPEAFVSTHLEDNLFPLRLVPCLWYSHYNIMSDLDCLDVSHVSEHDRERRALVSQMPGFHIRPPPKPHHLSEFITAEEDLFQTVHMGVAEVDKQKWLLVVDGLVERPFALTFAQLLALPSAEVTSFHECFGSPLTAPMTALWRVGNVTWTGVPLRTLLLYARPLPSAGYVWSEGLDSGVFAGVYADRYQKDLPLGKALCSEVLVAFKINGQLLSGERGGPVRLVVPGWFGTNSTKWLSKLTLREGRAPGPYTTRFYNIDDPSHVDRRMRPVWEVDVNSMIVRPAPGAFTETRFTVEGWSWSHDGVVKVEVSSDGGKSWKGSDLVPRIDFSWQRFSLQMDLLPGCYVLMARATSKEGKRQALSGWRNHAHSIRVIVEA